jgi:hypothetical protein
LRKITQISLFLTSVSLGQEGTLSNTRTLLLFLFSDFKTLSAKRMNLVKNQASRKLSIHPYSQSFWLLYEMGSDPEVLLLKGKCPMDF